MGLFFNNPKAQFYVREIQRLLGGSVTSLHRHLNELEKEGLLVSRTQGPLRYFLINPNYPYLSELKNIVLSEQRRALLEKNLIKIMRSLKKNYHPDKVVLFGSLASGRVSPDGDIDLLIVKKDVPKRYWDRVRDVAKLIKDCDCGIDYVIWTPEELAHEAGKNLFLKEEILKKGKVLYDRAA